MDAKTIKYWKIRVYNFNAAIRNLIREDKIHQIYSQMQIGQTKYGMQTMNQSLCDLFLRGLITLEECLGRSSEVDELKTMIANHLRSGAACTIAVEEVDPSEVYRYGIVKPTGGSESASDFDVEDLVEKPAPEAARSNLAIAARYNFGPMIFEAIRRTAPDRLQ